jgi:adenosylcobinamide-GDP ribazoletransferase
VKWLRREAHLFWTALTVYTRLPAPAWVGCSANQLRRSIRYFPAIGWIVGAAQAAVLAGAALLWPSAVAAVLALAAGALLTGAFHEDGFADVCDGLGGGTSREQALKIMKDPRVGAFGAIGLLLLLGAKGGVLAAFAGGIVAASSLPGAGTAALEAAAAIVFAHVASRWLVVTIMFRGVYARTGPGAKTGSKVELIARPLSRRGLAAATVWLTPAAALAWWHPWWLVALPVAFAARLALARWFRRRLGGYTGDCLGAAQQVTELVVLLTVLACVRLAA